MTDLITASNKHVLYAVRVIFERQDIQNVWQSHRWVVHDLVPLELEAGDGMPPINDVTYSLCGLKHRTLRPRRCLAPKHLWIYTALRQRHMLKILPHLSQQFTSC